MNIISYQKKLSRINRPRIHITYEVEIEGAQKQISLPFVVGVISDFFGDTKPDPERIWNYISINSDNIDGFIKDQNAKLNFSVPNILKNEGSIGINLPISSRASLEPLQVVKNIPELYEVYKKINVLYKLSTILSNNMQLSKLVTLALQKQVYDPLITGAKEKLESLNS
ncbi:type VI secretion protein [uncultured bacterium]|nr:type VI secretion protein [uncultured bacterium]